MWFTETPWPPIIVLSVVGVMLVGLWHSRRQVRFLVGLGVVVLLCVAIFVVERLIVTDAEIVEGKVMDLVHTAQQNNVKETLDFISPLGLKRNVAVAMALADIEGDVHITDMHTKMLANHTQAETHFRANATVNVHQIGHRGSHPSRWKLVWQKTGDDWKVIDIQRLNIIDGREIDITQQSE